MSGQDINRTLLTILDNQDARTAACLEGIRDDVFAMSPGSDCNSIQAIGQHLLLLRRFQLSLMGSPLATDVPDPDSFNSTAELAAHLAAASTLLRSAIESHDPEDWYAVPDPPREGKWGDQPTIVRLTRPLNDFVNHLGAIRAIRRVFANPADKTQ